MMTLLKKDLYIYGPPTYITIAVLVLLMSIITLPAVFIMVFGVFSLVLSTFAYDDKNRVNKYIISLPVKRAKIIAARYLFSISIPFVLLCYQWLLQFSFTHLFNSFPDVYNWDDFLLFFSLACIILAVCLPIVTLIKNVYLSIGSIVLLLSFGIYFTLDSLVSVLGMTDEIIFNDIDKGFVLLAHKYIPFQPYLFIILICFLLIAASMCFSIYMMRKRDF